MYRYRLEIFVQRQYTVSTVEIAFLKYLDAQKVTLPRNWKFIKASQ